MEQAGITDFPHLVVVQPAQPVEPVGAAPLLQGAQPRYLAIVGGAEPDADRALKRWNIRWTILAPRDALVAKLDRTPGWKRISTTLEPAQAVADARKQIAANADRIWSGY